MPIIEAKRLSAWYADSQALREVDIAVDSKKVTAIIGPSGCGKSTLVRCMNRMHEIVPRARVEGEVLLDGTDIYSEGVDASAIRKRVGMVFQKPNPFPNMSVRDNVVAGLRHTGRRDRKTLDSAAQESLERAFLWDEVKDKLHQSGVSLSGGQQQRLCIARALAVQPEVLLMDEPCSALDPASTAKIEELVVALKEKYTVVIVTHNLQQAARISDLTAFMYLGRLVEYGPTAKLLSSPKDELTERYVSGRFG